MPSYEQRAYLEASLACLEHQGSTRLELIIQDGGSQDGSVDLLQKLIPQKKYPIQFESKKDKGQAAAVNLGMAKAKGDILCFLNSDDLLYPGALPRVEAYFEQHPEVDLVYGRADFLTQTGEVIKPYPVEPWSRSSLMERCIICQPACFWRARLLEKVGPFDESFFGTFDYEYWLRASSVATFGFLDQTLAGSRCHVEAKTFKHRKKMIEESCEIQARHNQGITSLAHIQELCIINALNHTQVSSPSPSTYSQYLFYLRHAFYLWKNGSKTKEFLRPEFWKCFFPSYHAALRLEKNPLARIDPHLTS
jgi:glycosyltransferase involved in cell wall biosynthesis